MKREDWLMILCFVGTLAGYGAGVMCGRAYGFDNGVAYAREHDRCVSKERSE